MEDSSNSSSKANRASAIASTGEVVAAVAVGVRATAVVTVTAEATIVAGLAPQPCTILAGSRA